MEMQPQPRPAGSLEMSEFTSATSDADGGQTSKLYHQDNYTHRNYQDSKCSKSRINDKLEVCFYIGKRFELEMS